MNLFLRGPVGLFEVVFFLCKGEFLLSAEEFLLFAEPFLSGAGLGLLFVRLS